MQALLQLNSSIFSAHGSSSKLADQFVADYRAENPDTSLVVRDLGREPVPHLTAERFQALHSAPEQRSSAQAEVVAYSDALVAELKHADVLVLGLPMYNFGVPSGLCAYFDHIARVGVTFNMTATGVEGLLRGKKAYVLATRGGYHTGTARDTPTAHVRELLTFLGFEAVEFIYADGLNYGDAARQSGIDLATQRIASVTRATIPPPPASDVLSA
jgi:FMN-dependent NADH-azoreductase